jgi:hypothetical protein
VHAEDCLYPATCDTFGQLGTKSMSDNSKIEWTDATWNPVAGCTVLSPGCTNCYAMRIKTFLRNHADGIASIDLFVVPTISFRLLYGLLILRHGRRHMLWLGVTAHPTAEWIARQLTEACGWDPAPRYIVRDRDRVYGVVFTRRLRAMGIRDRPTAPRSPWQNGHTERLIGSIRRECLDHVIVFGERHLRHVLLSYMQYYNGARTHLSLNKDAPVPRAVQTFGRIQPTPILGGLHHQYVRI